VGLWFLALGIILAMVAVSILATRTSRPAQPQHGIAANLAARLAVIVIITAAAAAANIALGGLAAFATGLVGVLLAIVVLVRTGYAGPIVPITRPRP
jgi:hypothetical protein